MQLRKRIKLKLFFPVSLLITGGALWLSRTSTEFYVILGIYLATLVNFYFLLNVISRIVEIGTAKEPVHYSKLNLVLIFLGKMFVILAALTIGVQFMEKRIIIPLLNYVIQIFVLGVSLRLSN